MTGSYDAVGLTDEASALLAAAAGERATDILTDRLGVTAGGIVPSDPRLLAEVGIDVIDADRGGGDELDRRALEEFPTALRDAPYDEPVGIAHRLRSDLRIGEVVDLSQLLQHPSEIGDGGFGYDLHLLLDE